MIGLSTHHSLPMSDTPRYRVLHSLGKGGMGEVFLADDTQLGRQVAIKFLVDGVTNDGKALERLYREARSAAALDHPYICKIHEITEVDGRTGIVMEHVTGETLQTVLARTPLPPKRAIEIAGEVAEALEEAHKKRVVHRDLKPANVMLTEQGHVKVMDFGLAKQVNGDSGSDERTTGSLTEPGVRVGTPGYMSPEQLLGSQADERSDIFAFGVLLYELIAGVHPFKRSSPSGTMAAILREPHAPVGQYAKETSETTRVTLDRLLAKEPAQRYQSFEEVRIDLAQVLKETSGKLPIEVESLPALASRRTRFVGREAERAQGRRLLDRALGGQGDVLLIGGEPGVGKTRLAEELLADGRDRGCLVLTGRCYELEGTPPFIPWVEIVQQSARIVPATSLRTALGDAAPEIAKLVPELRQQFDDIPPPVDLPPEQQRHFLFSNFLGFVERCSRVSPEVLLLDDLHWADESTLLLLQHLAQHVEKLPVLIVGTYRDVDLDVARPFAEMLETLTRQRLAQRVPLDRLGEDGVGQMLEALSGQTPPAALTSVVFAETEGNPFFTEEVFHHLSEEGRLFDEQGAWRTDLRVDDLAVPEGVRLVIGRRVKRLGDDARRVLTTAAIVGRSFDVGLLEALGEVEGDALLSALEEAEAAKLIVPRPSRREVRWEFAHGLIRQTLEGSLSLMRRQRAHLRVADALEHVYGANAERHASDIAQHLYQAGFAADPERTVRFLTLAGDQALEAAAFDEALRRLTDALSIQQEHDPDDQRVITDLRFKRAQAIACVGHWEDAVAEWLVALDGFKTLQDHAAIALTTFKSWYTRAWNMRGEEGLDDVDGALAAVTVDGPERCKLLTLAGLVRGYSGLRGGDERISEAEAMAEEIGDPALVAEIAHHRTWHNHHFMLTRSGMDTGSRAETFYKTSNTPWFLADVRASMMFMQSYRGDFAELNREAPELERLADQAGHLQAACEARLWPIWTEMLDSGDLEAGRAALHKEVDRERRRDYVLRAFALLPLATTLEWLGEWEEALPYYREAAELEGRNMFTHIFASALLLARATHGDEEAISEILSMEPLARVGEDNLIGEWEQLLNVVEGRAWLVTEVYYVLSGSGTNRTGPDLIDAQRRPSDNRAVQFLNGPGRNAADIRNPDTHELKVGDVFMIPAGTGHQFTKIADHITYLMVRIDPDKVVPLMDEAAARAYLAEQRQ